MGFLDDILGPALSAIGAGGQAGTETFLGLQQQEKENQRRQAELEALQNQLGLQRDQFGLQEDRFAFEKEQTEADRQLNQRNILRGLRQTASTSEAARQQREFENALDTRRLDIQEKGLAPQPPSPTDLFNQDRLQQAQAVAAAQEAVANFDDKQMARLNELLIQTGQNQLSGAESLASLPALVARVIQEGVQGIEDQLGVGEAVPQAVDTPQAVSNQESFFERGGLSQIPIGQNIGNIINRNLTPVGNEQQPLQLPPSANEALRRLGIR